MNIAAIVLTAGVGDAVHAELGIHHALNHGVDRVHLYTPDRAMGLYDLYPGVVEHSNKATADAVEQCRQGGVLVELGVQQHAMAGMHRAAQYGTTIAHALGLPPFPIRSLRPPRLPVTGEEMSWGNTFFNAKRDQKKILFQVDSSRQSKSLPMEIANGILRHMVTRDSQVVAICKNPARLYKHPNIKVGARLTVRQLLSIAASADTVLGMDSAPTWMALAAGTPTIALFGATDPAFYAYETPDLRILTAPPGTCSRCAQHTCDHRTCMRSIGYEHIFLAVYTGTGAKLSEQFLEPPMMYSQQKPAEPEEIINVCVVTPYGRHGGSAKHSMMVAQGLQTKPNMNVEVIISRDMGKVFASDEGVPVTQLEGADRGWINLYRMLQERSPDVVLFDSDTMPAIAASNLKRKPLVVQVIHDVVGAEPLLRGSIHDVDIYVCVAQYIADYFGTVFGGASAKSVVIPNRVDVPDLSVESLRSIWNIPRDAWVIGTLARITSAKGIQESIDALSRLADEFWLVVGGDGRELHPYTELAARKGAKVLFPGYIQSIEHFLRSIDIALLASEHEGNSLFLLESALAGLPLVATNVGNVPFLFRHDESALIVEKTPESIADAVMRLRHNAALRACIGERAQGIASRYAGTAQMVEKYYQLITSHLRQELPFI
jgi:glycosyltransferase involved in cell wall biosynthesis